MPHNYRHEGFRRSESERDYRTRPGSSRGRYGYPGDFDPRYPRSEMEERSQYSRSAGSRSPFYGEGGRGFPGMRWERPGDDSGDYFGTGVYYGAYGSQPGASASGSAYLDRDYLGEDEGTWREREEELRRAGDYGPSSGDFETYGSSRYGAQSAYGRDYGERLPQQESYGQDYRERFAEQRYGRDPEFGYGFDQGEWIPPTGTHRGRGPKGYVRSDERLREMICERLTDDPRIDASDVSIEVRDKVVKLSGAVPDRRTKYEIEDVVERCGGVKDIENQIRVKAGYGMTQSSGSHIGTSEQSGIGGSGTSEGKTSRKRSG
jgi:hypothetical protein